MTDGPTIVPMGEAALLVTPAGTGTDAVVALYRPLRRALEERAEPGVLDVVPAAETVLVCFDPGRTGADRVRAWLQRTVAAASGHPASSGPDPPAEVVIAVTYDGADLDEVGELTGLGPDGVVEAHSGGTWTVAFTGFAPGFAYLSGGDARLRVPRRAEPRPAVPAGSVGLAEEFSGIYPRPSPGGWRLIGRTDAVLWDATRDPPALLQPGQRVRFVPAPAAAPRPGSG